jgi:hypothetical protein
MFYSSINYCKYAYPNQSPPRHGGVRLVICSVWNRPQHPGPRPLLIKEWCPVFSCSLIKVWRRSPGHPYKLGCPCESMLPTYTDVVSYMPILIPSISAAWEVSGLRIPPTFCPTGVFLGVLVGKARSCHPDTTSPDCSGRTGYIY